MSTSTITPAEQHLLEFFRETSPLHFASALNSQIAVAAEQGDWVAMPDYLLFLDRLFALQMEKEGAKA